MEDNRGRGPSPIQGDGRVLLRFLIGCQTVPDGQSEQPDAGHGRPFCISAAISIVIAPAAIPILAGHEPPRKPCQRPLHRHTMTSGGPERQRGKLAVGVVGGSANLMRLILGLVQHNPGRRVEHGQVDQRSGRRIALGLWSQRLQEVLTSLGSEHGTAVTPAAAEGLPRNQTEGKRLDPLFVRRVAEPVQEENRQCQIVGAVQFGAVLPYKRGGQENGWMVLAFATFQERQTRHGGIANQMILAVGGPGTPRSLDGFEKDHAVVDGLINSSLKRYGQRQAFAARGRMIAKDEKHGTEHEPATEVALGRSGVAKDVVHELHSRNENVRCSDGSKREILSGLFFVGARLGGSPR